MYTLSHLVMMTDLDLRRVDPVEMNLVVAKGIPALSGLDIARYQGIADSWAKGVVQRLPRDEPHFWKTPWDWDNDINLFRLGVLSQYLDEVVGIRYREEQKYVTATSYADPSDLFVNGVMDSRCGTCGNMAALYVGMCWRFGWPVTLACAGYHLLCRYDDGRAAYNIETTTTGRGGFRTPPDEFYDQYRTTHCGYQFEVRLKALTPREVLGVFVGLRARHYSDLGLFDEAHAHYRLAYRLCPVSGLLAMKAANAERVSPAQWYRNSVFAGMGTGVVNDRPMQGPWRSLDITPSGIEEACAHSITASGQLT